MSDIQETDPPFKLGQRVLIKDGPDWRADHQGTIYRVVGMRFDRAGKIDMSLSEDWPKDGGFDGVSPDDLTPA